MRPYIGDYYAEFQIQEEPVTSNDDKDKYLYFMLYLAFIHHVEWRKIGLQSSDAQDFSLMMSGQFDNISLTSKTLVPHAYKNRGDDYIAFILAYANVYDF